MSNPFANWTPEMVESHNRKHGKPSVEVFADEQKPIKRADQVNRPWEIAELESGGQHGSYAKEEIPGQDPTKFFVRIISVRKRMLDDDRICEVYLVDALRYAGIIPDDRPQETRIVTWQRKAGPQEAEHTKIEVYPPMI